MVKVTRRVWSLTAMALATLVTAFLLSAQTPPSASALVLGSEDVRIAAAADSDGYDLYIRAKPGLSSVLLVESTKDPAMKADNFAYRATSYNPVNGDEKRVLNGKELSSSLSRYSLVSSTPVKDESFGQAYHLFIPAVLVYGYPWSRSGEVNVGKGTFINIRAFDHPYADYAGAFKDNPYQIDIAYEKIAPPPVQAVGDPAPQKPPYVPKTIVQRFGDALHGSGSLDLVLCLDTTASMQPYFDEIKKALGPLLRERTKGFSSYRIGVVLYKDYWPDEYITRKYPFTDEIDKVMGIVNSAAIYGGGDIPEALYEALYSAATDYDWKADRRLVLYLTDAAPHPSPKGKILYSDDLREIAARHIDVEAVIVPEAIRPPNPPHLALENIGKKLALLLGSGAAEKKSLIAVAEGPDSSKLLSEFPDDLKAAMPDTSSPQLLASREIPLPSDGTSPDSTLPWFQKGDKDALDLVKAGGAGYLILFASLAASSLPDTPASSMSQTIIRLLDTASGKELARDVGWRVGLPSGDTALFFNGLREK